MFSTNPYTRRRQQKAATFFVVSGVFTAVGLCVALQKPRPTPTTSWTVTLDENAIVVRDGQTGTAQTLIAPLNERWASVERVNRVRVSGDRVVVEARKLVGERPEGYLLQDVTLVYSARTGVPVQK